MKSRKTVCILTGIFAFVLTGCAKSQEMEVSGFLSQMEETSGTQEEHDVKSSVQETSTVSDVCYVFVCGAVQEPGIYELPYGSRIYEALALAGGVTEDGAYMAVNQVEQVYDGQQIYIPTNDEYVWEGVYRSESGLVNLNTATKQELMTLNGIGESKAEAIIAYREEHGGFSSVEELMEISGIKEAAFEKIRDSVTVK